MDIKVLIGALNRPWLIEPMAAQKWVGVLNQWIGSNSMPQVDKRPYYSSLSNDYGDAFRMNPDCTVSASGIIQVLKIQGPITKYDNCGTPGTTTLIQLINAAVADESVKGILLWMDTPGGQADGTENCAFAVEAAATVKPIVTFADSMLCSAGYWIASPATSIVADKSNGGWNATIGSIGTMCQWQDDSKALQKQGIVQHFVFADDSEDKWGDYFAANNGDYTRLKEELNGLNDSFLSAIQANRAGKLNLKKENVLTGKTYNANEALAAGLVDKIGNFNDAVAELNNLINDNLNTNDTTQTPMSKENHSFQNVLTVAKAESFPVVNGGFLLTEADLNAIDAKLSQDATVISTTAATLITLQAKEADFTKLDELKTAHQTATATVATQAETIKQHEDKIKSLETENQKLSKSASFANPPATEDETDPAEEDQKEAAAKQRIQDSPSMQAAAKTLGWKKKPKKT